MCMVIGGDGDITTITANCIVVAIVENLILFFKGFGNNNIRAQSLKYKIKYRNLSNTFPLFHFPLIILYYLRVRARHVNMLGDGFRDSKFSSISKQNNKSQDCDIVGQKYLQKKGELHQVRCIKKVFRLVFPSPENTARVTKGDFIVLDHMNIIIMNNTCNQI